MTGQKPREISRPVWYGREDESPKLLKGRFGIEFTIASATGPVGETLALFAAARLGVQHAEMYGTRAGAATEIVALECETGQVYHERATRIDSAPFEPLIPTPKELEEMDAVVDEVESNFNVDLCAHLGLPPEGGRYHVFCWMDDLKSEVRTVEVPANEQRPVRGLLPKTNSLDLVPVATATTPFPRGAQRIPLKCIVEQGPRPAMAGQDRLRLGVQVYGRVDPDLLPAEPPLSDEGPLWLTVLVRSHLDRGFAWHTVPVPEECIEERSVEFRFQPFRILDPPERPQRHFVLVAVGATISEVLIIEPGDLQTI